MRKRGNVYRNTECPWAPTEKPCDQHSHTLKVEEEIRTIPMEGHSVVPT